jgi:hypothetical protein
MYKMQPERKKGQMFKKGIFGRSRVSHTNCTQQTHNSVERWNAVRPVLARWPPLTFFPASSSSRFPERLSFIKDSHQKLALLSHPAAAQKNGRNFKNGPRFLGFFSRGNENRVPSCVPHFPAGDDQSMTLIPSTRIQSE